MRDPPAESAGGPGDAQQWSTSSSVQPLDKNETDNEKQQQREAARAAIHSDHDNVIGQWLFTGRQLQWQRQ